jgi:hypothetical protein
MKLLARMMAKVRPICPIAAGEAGPYRYEQIMKDGAVVMEVPLSCLRFMKIREFALKRYNERPERHIWVTAEELKLIRAHKHTVVHSTVKREPSGRW